MCIFHSKYTHRCTHAFQHYITLKFSLRDTPKKHTDIPHIFSLTGYMYPITRKPTHFVNPQFLSEICVFLATSFFHWHFAWQFRICIHMNPNQHTFWTTILTLLCPVFRICFFTLQTRPFSNTPVTHRIYPSKHHVLPIQIFLCFPFLCVFYTMTNLGPYILSDSHLTSHSNVKQCDPIPSHKNTQTCIWSHI